MRIVPLCSSSKGNCTFIGEKDSGILIDVGCSYKAFCDALVLSGSDVSAVRAVLITHEHVDHINGLLQLTKRTQIPVYASEKTLEHLILHNLVASTANLHTVTELADVPADYGIKAFHTPHDSAESVGYTIDAASQKIGFCTDLGHVTDEVRENLLGCRTVFLEANYELNLLFVNPHYPMYLKKRISGDYGHLSNAASGDFCCELIKNGATTIILGHLSQENNTPDIARSGVAQRLAAGGIGARDCLLEVAPVKNATGQFVAV